MAKLALMAVTPFDDLLQWSQIVVPAHVLANLRKNLPSYINPCDVDL